MIFLNLFKEDKLRNNILIHAMNEGSDVLLTELWPALWRMPDT